MPKKKAKKGKAKKKGIKKKNEPKLTQMERFIQFRFDHLCCAVLLTCLT
jgi:hypothetical protein